MTKWEKFSPAHIVIMVFIPFWLISSGVVLILSMFDIDVLWIGACVAFTLPLVFLIIFGGDTKWMVMAVSSLTGARAVELYSCLGNEIHYSICYTNPNKQGHFVAPIYWFNRIGEVILLPDGTIDHKSESSYIDAWLPANKDQKLDHILRYGPAQVRNIFENLK